MLQRLLWHKYYYEAVMIIANTDTLTAVKLLNISWDLDWWWYGCHLPCHVYSPVISILWAWVKYCSWLLYAMLTCAGMPALFKVPKHAWEVGCCSLPLISHGVSQPRRLLSMSIIYKVRWQTWQSNCCTSILPPSNASETEGYFRDGCLGPHKSEAPGSSASTLTKHLLCLKVAHISFPPRLWKIQIWKHHAKVSNNKALKFFFFFFGMSSVLFLLSSSACSVG